jgi:hypothetical protein
VPIRWKKDRDLTGGLLDLVCRAWEAGPVAGGLSPEQRALKKKIENTGMGGLSFFAWFGFIGRRVSAEESAEATRLEREARGERKADKALESTGEQEQAQDQEEEEEAEDDPGMSLEIFPDGDDLAIAITEDLWPGAIKYFSTSILFYSPFPPPFSTAQSNPRPHSTSTRTRRSLRRRLRVLRRRRASRRRSFLRRE